MYLVGDAMQSNEVVSAGCPIFRDFERWDSTTLNPVDFDSGLPDHRNHSLRLAGRPHPSTSSGQAHLDILPKRGQEVNEAFDRERSRAVAHQCRDVGLFDPEHLPVNPPLQTPQGRGTRLRNATL